MLTVFCSLLDFSSNLWVFHFVDLQLMGVSFVTGVDSTKIVNATKYVTNNYGDLKTRFTSNPFGDGKASERIVKVLVETIG